MLNSTKLEEAEPVLSQALLSRTADGKPLEQSDIEILVSQFSAVYQFSEAESEYLIKLLGTRYVTEMDAGTSLVNDANHNEDWYLDSEFKWNYWTDYQQLLVRDGWPTRVVSTMNTVTDKILGLLENPDREGEWERRGLVIGHVQSGKTANYIGLATKAADAGYKFIIVIAGIHNNLRTQTQERIDRGFIGLTSNRYQSRQLIGVGKLRPNRAMPVTVTTTDSDFKKSLAKSVNIDLKSLNNTFILVIKKNTSTLRSLYNWLKELNTREELGEKIPDIPMLLIDDEADNASINTKKPDLDPSKTNMWIRRILNLFRKRCYVGYTATPFANIFIDPDSYNEMIGQDLFPDHFIYSLDAPTNYFGPYRVFVDEEYEDKYVKDIDDVEDWIPIRHKKDFVVDDLPPSLKQAIRLFIISRAIRNLRGQSNKHHSMMINVSRYVDVQRQFKQVVIDYVDEIRLDVKHNYRFPYSKAIQNETVRQLIKDFEDEYAYSLVNRNDLISALYEALKSTRVFLINSKSDESLDYTAYSNDGDSLTAIAIGGLSLSRGLTIEGLTITYMYRNSRAYDTLMQMGRWFGYRDGYDDLCRIYMSGDSYGWYSHIAEATDELRNQIKRMRREGRTPADFGLFVRAHPDRLTVTAPNKMYHTENRELEITYSEQLKESHIVPKSDGPTGVMNEENRQLVGDFFQFLNEKIAAEQPDNTGSFLFRNVGWDIVHDFMLRFRFHEDMTEMKSSIPEYIQATSNEFPDWDVSFRSLKNQDPESGYVVSTQERTVGYNSGKPKNPPSQMPGWYIGDKNKVSGNSMFSIGLSDDQLEQAQKSADDANPKRKRPIYKDYTNARNKPILLIHLLDLRSRPPDGQEPEILDSVVPALSVSFPELTTLKTVTYVVGPVFLKQLELGLFDSPEEEEEDFDSYE